MKQVVNNRTKIIATIGPSSSDYQILREMVIKGVDVVRLNFSHGSHKDHKKVISVSYTHLTLPTNTTV